MMVKTKRALYSPRKIDWSIISAGEYDDKIPRKNYDTTFSLNNKIDYDDKIRRGKK